MLALTLAALVMLEQSIAIIWKNDGSFEISLSFAAKDPANPFPQGEGLLLAKAREVCGDKGAPVAVGEPVVTGIAIEGGKPVIAMSGTYACRKG
ncbi:hypothetical protein [Erythrobacter oryzae]|uniref:hypothetical protein n=1 Tax=Erythrobacter oryzae TaxID=3019556 RepID=UPI002554C4EB|nr:hypothetical protein [Erythrobacter sp. COR-2]